MQMHRIFLIQIGRKSECLHFKDLSIAAAPSAHSKSPYVLKVWYQTPFVYLHTARIPAAERVEEKQIEFFR